ncbi:hypothetical protein NDU88_004718 [Pleurodeles waltl]|uniref:Uncharacterized protein n=1 Tax=Pleurodeles waltl TaxID=8319 RepID=A0AAV7RLA5_PLEWA|nr:hypothetical protein NDU88_004718 [Pleurodeles waltl]
MLAGDVVTGTRRRTHSRSAPDPSVIRRREAHCPGAPLLARGPPGVGKVKGRPGTRSPAVDAAAEPRTALWMRWVAVDSWRPLRAAVLSEEARLEPGRRCWAGECAAPVAKKRLGDLDTPGHGLWSVLRPGVGVGRSGRKRSWCFPVLEPKILPEPPLKLAMAEGALRGPRPGRA